jgi:alkylation response protein AidB-like acyl-CoA dehydrogenase
MATATVSAESIRADARRFVADHWDLDLTLREWWSALFDAGLAAPTWPEEFGGRSLSAGLQRIITEEFAAAHVVSPPLLGIGPAMVGPTILRLGTDEQKRKYLPALAKGEDLWCQLWSEPGAGSDLPAIAARALLDGDEYVVNGQKVWNSGADVAQRGILLARTNPDAAKRQGLTYFLFDMDQAGVEVRPLVQMNGHAEFCEVFLTDARVSADDVLGKVDDGWSAARVTMGFERAGGACCGGRGGPRPGGSTSRCERSSTGIGTPASASAGRALCHSRSCRPWPGRRAASPTRSPGRI